MKPALTIALAAIALAPQAAPAAENTTFKYDALGRLVQQFRAGGTADGTLTTIAHDPADNRSSYKVVNTVQTLHTSDRIYSPDNRFYLTLKANGNIAIVTAATSAELWSSGTTTLATDRATFQSDGNLILYSAANASLWATATASNPAAQLAMQSNGNLTIKTDQGTQIWQSNTGGH